MPCKPGPHFGMFMSRVIIGNGVDDFPRRNLSLDGIREADELLVAVTLHVAADHAAAKDVERGKQRRGAMPLVVVGHGPAPALLQGPPRLGSVQRLDLAFF